MFDQTQRNIPLSDLSDPPCAFSSSRGTSLASPLTNTSANVITSLTTQATKIDACAPLALCKNAPANAPLHMAATCIALLFLGWTEASLRESFHRCGSTTRSTMGEESIAVGSSWMPDVRACATWMPLDMARRRSSGHCVLLEGKVRVHVSARTRARRTNWARWLVSNHQRRRGPAAFPRCPKMKPKTRYPAREIPLYNVVVCSSMIPEAPTARRMTLPV